MMGEPKNKLSRTFLILNEMLFRPGSPLVEDRSYVSLREDLLAKMTLSTQSISPPKQS